MRQKFSQIILILLLFHIQHSSFFRKNWFENPKFCLQIRKIETKRPKILLNKPEREVIQKIMKNKVTQNKNENQNLFLIAKSNLRDFEDFFQMEYKIILNQKKYLKYMLRISDLTGIFDCQNLYGNQFKKDSVFLNLKCGLKNFEHEFQIKTKKKLEFADLFKKTKRNMEKFAQFLKYYIIILKEGFYFQKETFELSDLVISKCTGLIFFGNISQIKMIPSGKYETIIQEEINKINQLLTKFWKETELLVLENSRNLNPEASKDSLILNGIYSSEMKWNVDSIKYFIEKLSRIKIGKSICGSIWRSNLLVQRLALGMKSLLFYANSYPFKIKIYEKIRELVQPIRNNKNKPSKYQKKYNMSSKILAKKNQRQKVKIRKLSIKMIDRKVDKSFFQSFLKYKMQNKRKKNKRVKKIGYIKRKNCENIILNSLKISERQLQIFRKKEDLLEFDLKKLKLGKKYFEVESKPIKNLFRKLKYFQIIDELIQILKI